VPIEAPVRDPGPLRSFDPVEVGRLEAAAWAAYYQRQWLRVLVLSVALTHRAFGMDWPRTVHGAWLVLRANQLWAPYPANDPAGARRCMRRFYALLRLAHGGPADPARAAVLEVDWWAAHRVHQHQHQHRPGPRPPGPAAGPPGPDQPGPDQPGPDQPGPDQPGPDQTGPDQPAADQTDAGGAPAVTGALARLYAYLYSVDEAAVRPAAEQRAAAMTLSDEWVAQGCPPGSALLTAARAALVRSYAALLTAVHC
jgi:hypothetical protein